MRRSPLKNAAGQTLVEFVLLTALFLIFVGKVARDLPLTFSGATPYLGAKLQGRLQTGAGFTRGGDWQRPVRPKGGVKDQ
ncbi:MAG: hypothetical protein IT289_09820 [Oligoflexia bacterium]|nr:hypothetical protein [Oligoflexia bacterium]